MPRRVAYAGGGVDAANYRALRAAVDGLSPKPWVCFIDHYVVPGCQYPTTPLPIGDQTSAAVAAASIIAKTTRDRQMEKIAAEYPGWGFQRHKGYPPAPERRAALHSFDELTPYHRKSCAPAIYHELGLA